jgi:hypothetical protein
MSDCRDANEVPSGIEIVGRTLAAANQPYLRIGRTSNYKWVWSDELVLFPPSINREC